MGPLSSYWPEINHGSIENRENASNPFPSLSQDCVVEPLDECGLSDSALDSELVRFKNEDGFVRRDLVRDSLRDHRIRLVSGSLDTLASEKTIGEERRRKTEKGKSFSDSCWPDCVSRIAGPAVWLVNEPPTTQIRQIGITQT